jgi:chitinase
LILSGLDLDWEYPTQRGGLPQDKETFVLLVQELSKEFKKHNLHLSSAFGAAKKTIDSAYSVARLAPYLDTMHIMCYDYFGAWDKKIGFNAPLGEDSKNQRIRELTVEYSIKYFLDLGAPAEKLIMGLPFYGRTFITKREGLVDDESDDQGFQGPFTRENGFMGYNEVRRRPFESICVMMTSDSHSLSISSLFRFANH